MTFSITHFAQGAAVASSLYAGAHHSLLGILLVLALLSLLCGPLALLRERWGRQERELEQDHSCEQQFAAPAPPRTKAESARSRVFVCAGGDPDLMYFLERMDG